MEKILDCMGMACPLPVVRTKKEFENFTEQGILEVHVDNDTAVQNLMKLSEKYNYSAVSEETVPGEYHVRIEINPKREERTKQNPSEEKITTVVLSSDKMGTGEDELGRTLMKGFIFALTNVDPLPQTIICYNSGAFLTTEGSASLEDLKNLEAAGVKIMTCGTCLNYYGIKEKLQVGGISNMYDIAEMMNRSTTIIRP